MTPDGSFARRVRAEGDVTVDVVIPYYNHGVFVEEAIASVRAQSHPIRRVIVVDDGSTDPWSRRALDSFEGADDIEVVRQSNQGPSAARNRGIERSEADAVLLFDGDDVLEPHHVAFGLARLRTAEGTVGFAYPDQQSFGAVDELAIMPPYNLYVLGKRNFCGTASIVDAGVFAAGHHFREDLRHGHEDWEFFLRLGMQGIYGVDFHGAPVNWRRWGYSRSDGVNDRVGTYTDEVSRLHPELLEPQILMDVKRRWAPALSIIVVGMDAVDDPFRLLARQTCGDYEVLVPGTRELPAVRGRWVLVVDAAGPGRPLALFEQPDLVERVLRVGIDTPTPTALLLVQGELPGALARWQQVDGVGHGDLVGAVIDGKGYDEWLAAGSGGGAAIGPDLSQLTRAGGAFPRVCWVGRASWQPLRPIPRAAAGRPGALPPPASVPIPVPTPDTADSGVALLRHCREALGQEQRERWTAAPLFFSEDAPIKAPVPPAGFDDPIVALTGRAWANWTPSHTVPLDLVLDGSGHAVLEIGTDAGTRSGARVVVGRIWTRNYPGTVALYSSVDLYTHRQTYRVSDGPPGEREIRMGYLATEAHSDTVSFTHQLQWAVERLSSGVGALFPPPVVAPPEGAFLEPVTPADAQRGERAPHGRRAPWLCAAGGIGSTLYEVELTDGRFRYSTHPDSCVAHPDVLRPVAVAVAELGPMDAQATAQCLQELRDPTTGGISYVTGPVDGPMPTRTIGAFALGGGGAPLVRLRPGVDHALPVGEPGHRLAVDWEGLVERGYVPEGVVGYAWRAERAQAPLYCWDGRGAAGGTRLLTLGELPFGDSGSWRLRGTLGLAWRPGTGQPDLADLWELRRGGEITYAVDPSEFEPHGFLSQRIVAKVSLRRDFGALPLWRTALGNQQRWRFTTCPDEDATEGFVRQGIVCFLDPAHPQLPETVAPAEMASPQRTAAGLRPFGRPLYRVTHESGRPPRVTPNLPTQPGAIVEEVVGYLPPHPAYEVWGESTRAEAPALRAGDEPALPTGGSLVTAAARLDAVLRRAATHLPVPARRFARAAWQRALANRP